MEKKELTVRDLIKELLEFNMDAKVAVNIRGVRFLLYTDFLPCWNEVEGNCGMSYEEWIETKRNSNKLTFHFFAPKMKNQFFRHGKEI